MPQGKPARWDRVHARLVADADAMVDAAIVRFRVELPRYGRVPGEELRPTTRANITHLLNALVERRGPTEAELAEAALVGEVRAHQGIPTDEVMRGFRIVVREVWTREQKYAREGGLDDKALLEAAQFMWEWADLLMARAAAVHREVELELARRDHEERSRTIFGLLLGSLDASEVEDRAAIHGLRAEGRYTPIRARPVGPMTPSRLEHALRDQAHDGRDRGLVTIADGEVIGLLPARPVLRTGGVVGVGPEAPLYALASSYRTASRMLDAARAFGLVGVVGLDELGLRGPVHASAHLGDRLVERYVTPLVEAGTFGQTLLLTLSEHLGQGLRVERTAERLHIHPNTLRHRLRRFEQLTGENLEGMEQLFELWWALERARIAHPAAGRAVEEHDARP